MDGELVQVDLLRLLDKLQKNNESYKDLIVVLFNVLLLSHFSEKMRHQKIEK